MTQSTIPRNIITSFQKIHMSFGISVSLSHYATFKLIKKEEQVLLLNLLVHSFHGEVTEFLSKVFVYVYIISTRMGILG